jgi:hypothetical protein
VTLLPAVRAQLYEAAVRRAQASAGAGQGRGPRRRSVRRWSGRWGRAPLIAIAIGLLAVGGALAAGLIPFGAPERSTPEFSNPRADLGALTPGTVRLLPLATADPGGGPPWGLRVLSTTRGVGCIQVGRLLDGKLGVLGQDGAFRNDGRFHVLPVNGRFNRFSCAALDANGRIFNNVTVGDQPASGSWFGRTSCVPAGSTRAENPLRNPVCPAADERNLYYGLLGPYAKSITYSSEGRSRTIPTVGVEGAYLIVTRAAAHQLLDFPGAGTADEVPVDGPITEIHYTGGATCHLTSRSWIGGASACSPSLSEPVGYAPVGRAPTRAQVTTPLHVRVVRNRRHEYEIRVRFISRVALNSYRSEYSLRLHQPAQPPQVNSYYPPSDVDIAAGQRVTLRAPLRGRARAGVYAGTVTLIYASGPALLEGPGTVYVKVADFSARVP